MIRYKEREGQEPRCVILLESRDMDDWVKTARRFSFTRPNLLIMPPEFLFIPHFMNLIRGYILLIGTIHTCEIQVLTEGSRLSYQTALNEQMNIVYTSK